MSATSVDLLDLQPDAEAGRVLDPADRDRKLLPDAGSFSSASSADDEGDLLELIPSEKSLASDHHPDGIKSAPLLFERISEEERGSSDGSSQEKGSPDRCDKGSTGSQEEESDEESSKSSKRSSAERESHSPPGNRTPAAAPGPKSAARPSLTRMTAVNSSIKTSKKSCIKDNAAAEVEAFDDVESEEKARVREGMHTILNSFSGPADPFAPDPPPPAQEAPQPPPGTSYSLTQLSPTKVKRLLPLKPAPERLLPIGPPREPSPKPVLLKSHAPHDTRDPQFSPVERLLPIGPSRDRSKSPVYKKFVSPATTPVQPVQSECGLFFDPLPTCQPPPKPPRLHQRQQAEVVITVEADGAKHSASTPEIAAGNLVLTADDAGVSIDNKHQDVGVSDALTGKGSVKPQIEGEEKQEAQKEEEEAAPKVSSEMRPKKKKKEKKRKEGKDTSDKVHSLKESKKKSVKSGSTPRQATLESLGQSISLDMDNLSETGQKPAGRQFKQRRQQRREAQQQQQQQRSLDNKSVSGSCGGVAAGVQRRARKAETTSSTTTAPGKRTSVSQASVTADRCPTSVGYTNDEGVISQRCNKCNNVIEEFSDEEIGMCIVILRTYVHREPGMAAPLMPDMLRLVTRFTSYFPNAWQYERFVFDGSGVSSCTKRMIILVPDSNVHLPGNSSCIAKQVSLRQRCCFIRYICVCDALSFLIHSSCGAVCTSYHRTGSSSRYSPPASQVRLLL